MQTDHRARMQTDKRPGVDARPFLTWAFGIGISLWVAATAILAIPHGPGHSIESMTPFVFVRDIAFPLWLGAFVSILAGLALRAWRSLTPR
jgi:hypothetical protein